MDLNSLNGERAIGLSRDPLRLYAWFPMARVFTRLLDGLDEGATPEVHFANVIQAYVWGAAALEAAANDFVKALFRFDERQSADLMVGILERRELVQKIEVSLAIHRGAIDLPNWRQRIKIISEARNRILHYKDDDLTMDGEWEKVHVSGSKVAVLKGGDIQGMHQLLDVLPPASIVRDMLPKKVADISSEVHILLKAIDDGYNKYFDGRRVE